jgi:hypothetical protein
MAFDDTQTDKLVTVACVGVVSALIAPTVERAFGGSWHYLLFLVPVITWLVFERLKRG